jgi:hypothetical protein
MVLNPILLGGVWFIIHRYSVFHTFIWRGWVGGLSQMKLTSFEKNCHILRRSLNNQIIATSRQLHHLRISFSIVYTQGLGASLFFPDAHSPCEFIHSKNKCLWREYMT